LFFFEGDIQKIIEGKKTQIRRDSVRYEVGDIISLSSEDPSVPLHKIKIIEKKMERRNRRITVVSARKEGGYTPKEFEDLYVKMYPNWKKRYAYIFALIPNIGKSIPERVLEIARRLTSEGKTPFTRKDIQFALPDVLPGSLNPILQAMTKDTLGGSAIASKYKNNLRLVSRETYEIIVVSDYRDMFR
jgi:hypothetical protein